MTTKETSTPTTSINFHFDPACPLAWRTALWIREVRKVRPVDVTWRLFSLEVVNRKEGTEPDYQNGGSWAALRTLALARRQGGNEAFEKLYLTLGAAQHGRKESIKQLDVLRDAAKKAGLDPAIVDAALADESTIHDVLADHEEAVQRYRAFGVPTIAIEGLDVGFYGPIIQFVPRGEEAGEMWDYMAWALRQPNLFELKRDRGGVKWEPIAE
jgi:predicted DsbA family dithiol-disulfide isomerase